MSRKSNTIKFIKDLFNDRYALVIGNEIILDTKIEPTNLQRTAIQSVAEVLLWPSFDAAKEMAGSSHTPACCVSKLRRCIEAGWSMATVCIGYVKSKDERDIKGGYIEVSWSCNGNLTKMSRKTHVNRTEVCALPYGFCLVPNHHITIHAIHCTKCRKETSGMFECYKVVSPDCTQKCVICKE